jgi:hypothetical protein
MKFAKASITRQGPLRLLDASASSQKGRGSNFRFCSRDRPCDGSPEQYHHAAAVRDVTKLWS